MRELKDTLGPPLKIIEGADHPSTLLFKFKCQSKLKHLMYMNHLGLGSRAEPTQGPQWHPGQSPAGGGPGGLLCIGLTEAFSVIKRRAVSLRAPNIIYFSVNLD